MENLEWVLPITVTTNIFWKLRVCVNYWKLNDCTKKDYYPLPFIDDILDEIINHELYNFGDGYNAYNQIKIAKEDILKTTFTIPWGTFAYMVMPFGWCNAPWNFSKVHEQGVGTIH